VIIEPTEAHVNDVNQVRSHRSAMPGKPGSDQLRSGPRDRPSAKLRTSCVVIIELHRQ